MNTGRKEAVIHGNNQPVITAGERWTSLKTLKIVEKSTPWTQEEEVPEDHKLSHFYDSKMQNYLYFFSKQITEFPFHCILVAKRIFAQHPQNFVSQG